MRRGRRTRFCIAGLFYTGFQLDQHVSGVEDWHNPHAVADTYYREIEAAGRNPPLATENLLENTD